VKSVGLAAAACVLLALTTGCGPDVMNSASASGVAHSEALPKGDVPVAVADRPAKFGERRAAGESLMVTVSAPTSFVPGETAYPRAPRAVAFEVAIDNQGSRTYRPSQLQVRATTLDGQVVVPVVDTAQGYTGVVGGSTEIPPGKGARLTLAFAMPADQVELRVTIQQDASSASARAEFQGIA
jgi:hypothetical protein